MPALEEQGIEPPALTLERSWPPEDVGLEGERLVHGPYLIR
jgi:hypothetical protein